MMCQRIGWWPIFTMGFGRYSVSSRRRVPRPPARITTGISKSDSMSGLQVLRLGVQADQHVRRELLAREEGAQVLEGRRHERPVVSRRQRELGDERLLGV